MPYTKAQYSPKTRIFQLCYDKGKSIKAYVIKAWKTKPDVLQPLNRLEVFYGGSDGWCFRLTKDVVDQAILLGSTLFISEVHNKGGKSVMGEYYITLADVQKCKVVFHANQTLEKQYEINIRTNTPTGLYKTGTRDGKMGFWRVIPTQ